MSEPNKPFAGIDVSKEKLDVAISNNNSSTTFQYDQGGLRKLLQLLKKNDPETVCLEATGGLERRLVNTLQRAGHDVCVVNPRQIRDFVSVTRQLGPPDNSPKQTRLMPESSLDLPTVCSLESPRR